MCKNVLLDVDGVMADFVGGMMTAHNKPWPYSGVFGDKAWDLAAIWGLQPQEFWAPCGYSFWRNLEKMAEADAIFQACVSGVGRERICFMTSPCRTDGCMDGKRDWLEANFPGIPVLFALGSGPVPPKQFCASRGAVLIDDYSRGVDNFIAWGGSAFLVARPWNRNYDRQQTIVEDLREFLDESLYD